MEIALSLGSNLGDRVDNMRRAHAAILETADARELAASPLYDTEPVGVKPEFQHMRFANSVLIIESQHSAKEWLGWIHDIEYGMGRSRDNHDRNAPREVDIDILYAGDELIDSGGLTVPHPRWAERHFVVQPLADVRPDHVLPGMEKTVRDVLASLGPAEGLSRMNEAW